MHTHAYAHNAESRRRACREGPAPQWNSRKDRPGARGSRGTHHPRECPTSRGVGRNAGPSPPNPETSRPMMLVDTSVWVDHFRHGDPELATLLERGEVECHPFIIGELACGNLSARAEILMLLRKLPETPIIEHDEALTFVDAHKL